MDVSDLQLFCTVAHTGGVTRAAERLHRVPSNVKTRLCQLEVDLGTQLFLRESKCMPITSTIHFDSLWINEDICVNVSGSTENGNEYGW